MTVDNAKSGGSTLQTVSRAFEVLRCFDGGEKVLSLGEVTALLGYNKVTVFRLCNTLVNEGVLAYDKQATRYRISFGLITLGRKLLQLDGLTDTAHESMEEARQKTNETVCLSVREHFEQVVVHSLPSSQPVRYVLEVGSRGSLYNGAAGQCLLVNQTQNELENMIRQNGFSLTTDNSVGSIDKLLTKIEFIQKNGYGISRGERIAEAAAVASPIFASNGSVVGVLSIVMPETRAEKNHLLDCAKVVIATAQKISNDFVRGVN